MQIATDADMAMVAGNARAGDERLLVQFYLKGMQDPAKSAEAGRAIFVDTPFIRIMVPGDKDNIIDRPVWDDPMNAYSDTSRFAAKWEAWKAKKAQPAEGTPIEQLPGITAAEVAELQHYNVRSVEQLAGMPDGNAQKLMGVVRLKNRAQDYITAAKGAAPAEQLREAMAQKDAELAALRQALKEQGERIEQISKQKK